MRWGFSSPWTRSLLKVAFSENTGTNTKGMNNLIHINLVFSTRLTRVHGPNSPERTKALYIILMFAIFNLGS